jgi:hypothetical protein
MILKFFLKSNLSIKRLKSFLLKDEIDETQITYNLDEGILRKLIFKLLFYFINFI